jgi:hypothetical protein
VTETYDYVRVLDEVYGIVYTFQNAKYGYTVYFNESVYKDMVAGCEILSQGSFSFGFFGRDLRPDERKVQDPCIGSTISSIIIDLFQKEGEIAVILFHCDGSDGRGLSRHKIFSKWYRESDIQGIVLMHQIEVDVEEQIHYLGFICHIDNPNFEQIKKEFEGVAQKLTIEAEKNRYGK